MSRTGSSIEVLAVVLMLGMAPSAAAQGPAADAGEGPRFLLASASELVPLDLDRTPSLAQRLELSLEDVPLKQALAEIARQAGLRLAFSDNDVPLGRRVHLKAEVITVAAALTDVLLGTGVDVVFGSDGGASLVRRSDAAVAQPGRVAGRVTDPRRSVGIAGAEVLLEGTEWRTLTSEDGRYLLADVAPGSYTITARRIGYGKQSHAVTIADGQAVAVDFSLQPVAARIGELVVTAQKREEQLQDVPIPVTAIPADRLLNRNQLRLQEYYPQIPGFSVTPGIQSTHTLSIRGITTGFGTNPTVGITVDDVPYGSAAFLGGGAAVPDLDPTDLARIEVLRGPQGTLYGASSIGGLLKFVTVDPSTDEVSGRVQVSGTSVHNGSDLGYNVRGSVNLPLGERLAVRASGFGRGDPGYIDDPVLGRDGVNSADVYGGRASALWRPSEALSLKLGALLQRSEGDGAPSADPALGDLKQSRVRGTGWYDRKPQAYSATLTAGVGNVSLTALSGYAVNAFSESLDYGFVSGAAVQQLFGVSGAELLADNTSKKFSQEVRLSAPLGPSVDWLLGAFYANEHSRYVQAISALDPATGAPVGLFRSTTFPTTYKEYATFTDLTFHLSDRVDVQLGGRASKIDQTFVQTQIGPGAITPGTSPKLVSDATAVTYLVTPRFKVSPDLMMYARLASGYRPGGPNAPAGPGTPPQFDPDKTRNYEVGIKGSLLDHRLSFDGSLYYIDWKDIQLLVLNPATSRAFNTNGSRAKSQGVELALESRPLEGLTVAGWVAWNDAKLIEDLPATATVRAVDGDRLPNTSRISGNLSVDQEFVLPSRMTATVGGSVSYVGEKKGAFTGQAGVRETFPTYTKVDVQAGLRHDSWALDLFATNLTDRRGVLYGGVGAFPPTAFLYIQPRTVGLSIARSF